MDIRFARRTDRMRPSTIREILKVTTQPDVISLAGGLPAPELFPVDDIKAAATKVFSEIGPQVLQYGESEGYRPLREMIAIEMSDRGIECTPDEILLTTGSQQVLDLVGKVFLDPGDVILTENPTYLAAIQAFQGFEANFVPVPTDDEGIIPEELPALIARYDPKFLYTIPNFQNPTGTTLTKARRESLMEIAESTGLIIVEDDPYGRLRYQGMHIPPIKSLDTKGLVIYASTFSKTVAPGLRLGWTVTVPEVLNKLIIAKQATDLHTSCLDQAIVFRYLSDYDNKAHVDRVRRAYGERYRLMNEALNNNMPDGFSWTHPEGGMFLWVTCPETLNTAALLEKAIQHKVIFVPGHDFFPDGSGTRYMRLNFSNSKPEKINKAITRLADLCKETLRLL